MVVPAERGNRGINAESDRSPPKTSVCHAVHQTSPDLLISPSRASVHSLSASCRGSTKQIAHRAQTAPTTTITATPIASHTIRTSHDAVAEQRRYGLRVTGGNHPAQFADEA